MDVMSQMLQLKEYNFIMLSSSTTLWSPGCIYQSSSDSMAREHLGQGWLKISCINHIDCK